MKKQLVLGAGEIAAEFLFPKLLPELAKKLPELNLTLKVRYRNEIYEMVARGELEVGIIDTKYDSDAVDFTPIIEADCLAMIAPPNHPLAKKEGFTINDLKGQAFVGFTAETEMRTIYEQVFSDAGLPAEEVKTVLEFPDTRAVVQAVESGEGVSVVSESAAADSIRSGKTVVLNGAPLCMSRTFYLISPKMTPLSPIAHSVISAIQEAHRRP